MHLPLLATAVLLAGGAEPTPPLEPATDWSIVAAETDDSTGCFMVAELPGGATLAIGVWHGATRERRLTVALQHDTWRIGSPAAAPAVDVAVGEVALQPLDPPIALPSGTGFSVPLAASEAALRGLAAGEPLRIAAGTRVVTVDLAAAGASFVDTMACAAARLEEAPDLPPQEPPEGATLSL